MLQKTPFILIAFFVTLFFSHSSYAATPPASQQMSGQQRALQMQQEEEGLQKQIEQERNRAKPSEETMQEPAESPTAQRVLIKSIKVTGVTLFPGSAIEAITSQYENKEFTLSGLQKIADRITDLYRKKGYIISRAHIPPQKIEQGILEITVIESKIGDIQLKGNRYYSTKLIDSYLTIKKGDFLNYNDLKLDLDNINAHPDRTVKSVLVPGQVPGETDIILNEQDALPVHIQMGYNNYLSSYLRSNVYDSIFTDNNLLGRDDIFYFPVRPG